MSERCSWVWISYVHPLHKLSTDRRHTQSTSTHVCDLPQFCPSAALLQHTLWICDPTRMKWWQTWSWDHLRIYACTCVYIYMCECVCVCVCLCVCLCVCVCKYTRVWVYILMCVTVCMCIPAYTQDMTSYTTVCTCRTVPYELWGAVQT